MQGEDVVPLLRVFLDPNSQANELAARLLQTPVTIDLLKPRHQDVLLGVEAWKNRSYTNQQRFDNVDDGVRYNDVLGRSTRLLKVVIARRHTLVAMLKKKI